MHGGPNFMTLEVKLIICRNAPRDSCVNLLIHDSSTSKNGIIVGDINADFLIKVCHCSISAILWLILI